MIHSGTCPITDVSHYYLCGGGQAGGSQTQSAHLCRGTRPRVNGPGA
jgi:hypothetical protein